MYRAEFVTEITSGFEDFWGDEGFYSNYHDRMGDRVSDLYDSV
jgi:hypothetical protein